MKKIVSAIVLFLVSVFIFAQHPRTSLVVNDSGGNQVKEVLLVRADNPSDKG